MENKVEYFVIHCTQTHYKREVTAADIELWHTSPAPVGRGWNKVGYGSLVTIGGTLIELVDNNDDMYVDSFEVTNGVKGINYKARHIVYAGGVNDRGLIANTLSAIQKNVLISECLRMIDINPDILIAGHNQFANKLCPAFDVRKEFANFIPAKNLFRKSPFYYV